LLAPLLLQLLLALIGVFPMALAIKAPLINIILNQFGLQLCNIAGGAPVAFPRMFMDAVQGFDSRSLKDAAQGFGFDISEAKLNIISDFATKAIDSLSSSYGYEEEA